MKVLVCGSRKWTEWAPIERELAKLPPGTIIIHGDCPIGADSIADKVARKLGFEVRAYPADWKKWKKAAGPIRNTEMIKREHRISEPIDQVLAFAEVFSPRLAPGTMDMMTKARKARIPVEPFSV